MAVCDRVGLLAQKKGMSQMFLDGKRVPLTLLSVQNCRVVGVRTLEKNGYDAIEVGLGIKKRPAKPLLGHFGQVQVPSKSVEFRLRQADPSLTVGMTLTADHFKEGQFIDVAGISLGKGFAGPMKAHNFGGLRASHGVSVSHRSHGSTGQRQEPGRVFKGKKMATHLGNVRVTVQNLKVVYINLQEGLIGVRGAVPGARDGYIWVRDAVKL